MCLRNEMCRWQPDRSTTTGHTGLVPPRWGVRFTRLVTCEFITSSAWQDLAPGKTTQSGWLAAEWRGRRHVTHESHILYCHFSTCWRLHGAREIDLLAARHVTHCSYFPSSSIPNRYSITSSKAVLSGSAAVQGATEGCRLLSVPPGSRSPRG